jgi:fructose-bisphosphate aldolase, class I
MTDNIYPRWQTATAASTGKGIRMRRLLEPECNSCCIVALDHGMTSPEFLPGLTDTGLRIKQAVDGGANVLMLSRGVASSYWDIFAGKAALALMLTASAAGRPSGSKITPIGSVEEALRLGADAVVVYVALGDDAEPDMIRYLSSIGEACEAAGLPLIAEAEFPDAYASRDVGPSGFGVEYLRRNARLCAELGADIVKVNWSGDREDFASVIAACGRPVVLAGGPVVSDEELLGRMVEAREAGAIGFSVGRNMFENRQPEAITRAMVSVFRRGATAESAMAELLLQAEDR